MEPMTELGPFSGPEATARPWAHTVDALQRTQKFMLCTVRADGRPHSTPLLAVWALDGLCFVTGANEQKAVNLASNPQCLLSAGTEGLTGLDYVIEGRASLLTDADDRDAVATAYEEYLGWNVTRPDGTWHGMPKAIRSGDLPAYLVRPTIGFAFGNGKPFSETRYVFEA